MAFETFLSKVEGTVNGLPIAKGEDATLPCYFTPHFFAVETSDGLFVSTKALTLRQIIALLEEKSYNYSNVIVHYSLEKIVAKQETAAEAVDEAEPESKPEQHKKSKHRGK